MVSLESFSSGAITCRSPAVASPGTVSVDVVYLNQTLYAESAQSLTFTYYGAYLIIAHSHVQ
jgi:hypothetical protein